MDSIRWFFYEDIALDVATGALVLLIILAVRHGGFNK